MSDVEAALEKSASGPWTDLGLTLPIFIAYHLGVIFLPTRNAADWATVELITLANNDLTLYGILTLGIGAVYIGILVAAGRGKALHWQSFVWLMIEAVVYAIAMRFIASYVVGRMTLGPVDIGGTFSRLILSFGAGFYEEVAFRVGLFALGYKALVILFPMNTFQRAVVVVAWALFAAMLFSLWHYIGDFADPLEAKSFVFRWVCGIVFTVIYAFRGFAPAVWTHALYDVWVLVF
jgi:hypothetical protein